ncbi:MAG: serine/threonine protein kinase [Xanthomonadales bacterium]|nr:serine/threonine protein kinase [Xanthomonadales bacterium]MDL1867818.1 serine/threonine protein kinase [Gammaproteobacteria bacterium PRO6]
MNTPATRPLELDDLKSAWQALDRQLQRQSTLQWQWLRERKLDTVRSNLRWLYWGQIAQILLGDALIYFGIMASIRFRAEPHLLACGLFLLGYGVLVVVLGGVMLGRVGRVDYGAPVLDIQKRIGALQRGEVLAGMWVGLPWWLLWLAIFMLEVKVMMGIDLWHSAPAFVWSCSVLGAVGLLATAWMYRHSRRAPGSRLAQWLDRRVGARSLRQARATLQDIARFEDGTGH